jgi:transcriptional regulator with XRE-family HTH domain
MDDVRLGRTLRALRHRMVWRQSDLADKARVSQDVVSRIERGLLADMPLTKVRRVVAALQGEMQMTIIWRGGELARVLDEGHASLVGAMIVLLRHNEWQVRPEVSYSVFGERGSIDILAWHEATCTLLVIEVKTELVSVEQTIRKLDEKSRLAARIAAAEFAWRPRATARLLLLPDISTPRRHVGRHEAVLGVAYPVRGSGVRSWLSSPSGSISGLMFLGRVAHRSFRSRRRIRVAHRARA